MKKTMKRSLWYASLLSTLLFSGCMKEDINEALGTNNPEVSIYVLRNLFKGNDITLDANVLNDANHIKAVVVSDHDHRNFPDNYIAVQNEWRGQLRGILLEVEDAHRFKFGDSLDVWIDGLKLTQTNGMLTLTGLDRNNSYIINRNNPVRPRPVSVAALNRQFGNYESTYVEITADLEIEPKSGEPIKGKRSIVDAEENRIAIFVSEQATFAEEVVAPSATFRGIALRETNEVQIRLLTYDDMAYPSGKIYEGWPETFENYDEPKTGYANSVVTLHTGPWWFQQTLLGTTQGRDRIVSGSTAVRFQQGASVNAILEMQFDVPYGASKVTFWYGSYWNDPTSIFKLEYSTNQGLSWQQIGDDITDAHTTTVNMDSKQAIFLMDIEGPVRFRLNRPALAGGRLGVDDVAIFRSY